MAPMESTVTEEISALKLQLAEKDAMIESIKAKTKDYVLKLKNDQTIALSNQEKTISKAAQVGGFVVSLFSQSKGLINDIMIAYIG